MEKIMWLILSGGRRTQVGLIGLIGFHVGQLAFGGVLWIWAPLMLVTLVLLLRAERHPPATAASDGVCGSLGIEADSSARPRSIESCSRGSRGPRDSDPDAGLQERIRDLPTRGSGATPTAGTVDPMRSDATSTSSWIHDRER